MNPVMTMAIAIIDVPMSLAPDSRELLRSSMGLAALLIHT
jgi:hypothetical protein